MARPPPFPRWLKVGPGLLVETATSNVGIALEREVLPQTRVLFDLVAM